MKPGQLWLGPDELAGGTEIAKAPMIMKMCFTLRENITFLLRI